MTKKILTALAVFLLLTGPSKAWADDVEIDCEANPTSTACYEQWNYDTMPINETDETTPISDDSETTPINDGQVEVIEDAEVIEEEETEPALWPMYLSLGALGIAILVFIVLNLFGGKKKS